MLWSSATTRALPGTLAPASPGFRRLGPMSRYVEGARKILEHVAERLQADLSVQLWNGEVLPLGPGARCDIRVVIQSPQVIARLLRSASLMTLVEEHISGGIQIIGGS